MSLGKAISYIRKQKGLDQSDICEGANITQSYVSMIENDKADVSLKTLKLIAKTLGVPYQLIFVYSITEDDFEAKKRPTFRVVFPSVKNILNSLITDHEN